MLLTIFRRLFVRCGRGSQTFLFCAAPFRQPSRAVDEISARFPFSEKLRKVLKFTGFEICPSFSLMWGGKETLFVLSGSSVQNPHKVVRFRTPNVLQNENFERENVKIVSAICQTEVHLFYPKGSFCLL